MARFVEKPDLERAKAFLADGGLATAEFRIPGILYTWGELLRDARFGAGHPSVLNQLRDDVIDLGKVVRTFHAKGGK